MPQTLASPAHHEITLKKSRFICCVQPISDRASAQAVVDALWQSHPGAAHVCWALVAGGQSAAVDDGEPSGTAGRPMLEVLRHQDLEGVLATVVRYFGGVKLGAGGLVRAYTDSVAQTLLHAPKVTLQRMCILQCSLPYAMEGWLRRELDLAGATLLNVHHHASVQMQWSLPESQRAPLVARINDGGQGRINWLKFWPA
jgi:uncharacterized YigZ family protein